MLLEIILHSIKRNLSIVNNLLICFRSQILSITDSSVPMYMQVTKIYFTKVNINYPYLYTNVNVIDREHLRNVFFQHTDSTSFKKKTRSITIYIRFKNKPISQFVPVNPAKHWQV